MSLSTVECGAAPGARLGLVGLALLAAVSLREDDESTAGPAPVVQDDQPGSQALSAARFHQYQQKYWQFLASQFPNYFGSFREFSRARASQRHFASRGIMESGPRFSVGARVLMPGGSRVRGSAGCHAVSAPPLSEDLDR
jgi:hypothetical protein